MSVVCCQVEVSAKDRSLVQRSHSECGVSECDREAPIMGCYAMGEKVKQAMGEKVKQAMGEKVKQVAVIVVLNNNCLCLTDI